MLMLMMCEVVKRALYFFFVGHHLMRIVLQSVYPLKKSNHFHRHITNLISYAPVVFLNPSCSCVLLPRLDRILSLAMYHLIATIRPIGDDRPKLPRRQSTAIALINNIDAIMIRIISRPAGLSIPQLRFQAIRFYGANRLPDLNLSHQIGDDQVSELASKPLHKFSLADLVRYAPSISLPLTLDSSFCFHTVARDHSLTSLQSWQSSTLTTRPLRLGKLYIIPPPHPPRPSHTRTTQLTIHSGSEPLNLPHLRKLPTLALHSTALLPPVNFRNRMLTHKHLRRGGQIHRSPRRTRRNPSRYDTYSLPWLPGKQEIYLTH